MFPANKLIKQRILTGRIKKPGKLFSSGRTQLHSGSQLSQKQLHREEQLSKKQPHFGSEEQLRNGEEQLSAEEEQLVLSPEESPPPVRDTRLSQKLNASLGCHQNTFLQGQCPVIFNPPPPLSLS